jgi:hypothetical protein
LGEIGFSRSASFKKAGNFIDFDGIPRAGSPPADRLRSKSVSNFIGGIRQAILPWSDNAPSDSIKPMVL